MQQLTPRDLSNLLSGVATSQRPLLLDVREPWEFDICRIDGSRLIPMRRIPAFLKQLDAGKPVVVICHHGIRSQQVALYMEQQGFDPVFNLQGGVDGWARDVDPKMATY